MQTNNQPHFPHTPHGRRPPWWPENEAWPPTREAWRRVGRRNPFLRRMGCFFLGFAFLALVGFLAILRAILAPFFDVQAAPSAERLIYLLPFTAAGFVLLTAAMLWGIRSVRRMSMPLDNLLSASNRVADGDYSVRVDEKGPPEVASLIRSFNAMAERLQMSDQQRRSMLADVSHELRTPITIIQGNVEGILDGLYPADQERLQSVLEETRILSRLVEDLRTMALAESGALHLKRELTSLPELVHAAAAGFAAQIHEKDIQLQMVLDPVEETDLDPQRVREVLTNLLSNALRYTPRGGEIRIRLTGAGRGRESTVTISIEDSGPGIEPGLLPYVFDRFYKSSDSGGMGLGLSIAKYLVEAHYGKIWAESKPGKGTTISFRLPA